MANIDLRKKVIGIPLTDCFICGKKDSTRHHVIPRALKPKRNITIPLCEEHKDCLHPYVHIKYVPPAIRKRINKIYRNSQQSMDMAAKIRKMIDFSKPSNTSTTVKVHTPQPR